MKKNYIELVFILDRSGSMGGLESDTIGGYNQFLAKQDPKNEIRVSTFLFDHDCTRLFDGVTIEQAKLSEKEYFVRGSTALLDAIGHSVMTVENRFQRLSEEATPEKVIFIITTDGQENSSKEFTYGEINKLISRRRLIDGWEFIFMGANLDVDKESEKLGISRQNSKSYKSTKQGTTAMYENVCNLCDSILAKK